MLEIFLIVAIVSGMVRIIKIAQTMQYLKKQTVEEYFSPTNDKYSCYTRPIHTISTVNPDILKNGEVYYWYPDPVRVRNGNLRLFVRISLLGLLAEIIGDAWLYREIWGMNWFIFLSVLFFLSARKGVKFFYSVFFCMDKPIFALTEKRFYFSYKPFFARNKLINKNFNTYILCEDVEWTMHIILHTGQSSPMRLEYLFMRMKDGKFLYFQTDNFLEEFKDYAAIIQDAAKALNDASIDASYEHPKYANRAYHPSISAWVLIILNASWLLYYLIHRIYCEIHSLPTSLLVSGLYVLLFIYNFINFLLPYRLHVERVKKPKMPPLSEDIPQFEYKTFWQRVLRR